MTKHNKCKFHKKKTGEILFRTNSAYFQEEEVLTEAHMMVPDTIRRLTKAFDELNEFLKTEAELKETKEYIAAKAIIEVARVELQQN